MKHIPKYKGSYKRTATAPGQVLTADTVTSKDDAWHAVLMYHPVGVTKQGHKPKNAFMVKDEYTGLKQMFPLHEKSTKMHEQAFKFLLGHKNCIMTHSDNSSEITDALANLGIPQSMSEPGVPQTNGVAERANQDILEGARTNLVQAGLPACFGPLSAECYCVNDNISPDSDGESKYYRFHEYKQEFNGWRLPFGCEVIYKPSVTSERLAQNKWAPTSRHGIFVGYELKPGYIFNGAYRVYDFEDFCKNAIKSGYISESVSASIPTRTDNRLTRHRNNISTQRGIRLSKQTIRSTRHIPQVYRIHPITCRSEEPKTRYVDKTRQDMDPTAPTNKNYIVCLLYTSPSPRDEQSSRMPSSA